MIEIFMKPFSLNLHTIFQEFIELCTSKYYLNDPLLYQLKTKPERDCLNPYFISESDVELKFGAFLESKIVEHKFCVHSQLRIYQALPKAIADLSIHKLVNHSLWTTNDALFNSLIAVIEVKYANFVNPDFDFDCGNVAKDILNLSSLKSGIGRYLLIMDEGCKISPKLVKNTRDEAIKYQIEILSNNLGFDLKTNLTNV
jgi:hypothetical protein